MEIQLGRGFAIAQEALGSRVERVICPVGELTCEAIGGPVRHAFLGALLLHLRDPVGALAAVRSVCDGWLVSSEQVELGLTLAGRRKPLFRLDGSGQTCQWWLPNACGHERLLWSAGFSIEARSRLFVQRFNAHPTPHRTLRWRLRQAAVRLLTRDSRPGVLHRAVLARPRV